MSAPEGREKGIPADRCNRWNESSRCGAVLRAVYGYAYFKDMLERLPTHPASRIDELLPHRWPAAS